MYISLESCCEQWRRMRDETWGESGRSSELPLVILGSSLSLLVRTHFLPTVLLVHFGSPWMWIRIHCFSASSELCGRDKYLGLRSVRIDERFKTSLDNVVDTYFAGDDPLDG